MAAVKEEKKIVQTQTVEKTKEAKPQHVTISDDVLIKVKSGFYGKLYYKNLNSGELTVWEHAGEVQVMSMRDLRAMKAQQVAFFKNQWVIILGVADGENCKAQPEDICRALVVSQYYADFIDPCNYDEACGWNDTEIEERVSMLSAGAKENLVVALNGYVKDGRLDSVRKIRTFEKALDCKLAIPE